MEELPPELRQQIRKDSCPQVHGCWIILMILFSMIFWGLTLRFATFARFSSQNYLNTLITEILYGDYEIGIGICGDLAINTDLDLLDSTYSRIEQATDSQFGRIAELYASGRVSEFERMVPGFKASDFANLSVDTLTISNFMNVIARKAMDDFYNNTFVEFESALSDVSEEEALESLKEGLERDNVEFLGFFIKRSPHQIHRLFLTLTLILGVIALLFTFLIFRWKKWFARLAWPGIILTIASLPGFLFSFIAVKNFYNLIGTKKPDMITDHLLHVTFIYHLRIYLIPFCIGVFLIIFSIIASGVRKYRKNTYLEEIPHE